MFAIRAVSDQFDVANQRGAAFLMIEATAAAFCSTL
jgi:hypothetical protein